MKRPKIIDFRCRPPVSTYKPLFELKLARLKWENKLTIIPERATSPSMYRVGEKEGLELLMNEMDEAGVNLIVIPGRNVTDLSLAPKAVLQHTSAQGMSVTDKMLVDLCKTLNNRAIGLHGIDLSLDAGKIVAEIEKSIQKDGFPGVVLEPGLAKAQDGGPLYADNKALYPIYETLVKHNVFLMHMSGIYAGQDIGANNWEPLDRVMQDFPKLQVVLAHGGYPRVIDAMALACKHTHLYLSPDLYCFFPGGRLYVEAISMLPDQFIFASAYPFGALKESVDLSLEFPLSDEVMEKYLYGNAARLLKLQ